MKTCTKCKRRLPKNKFGKDKNKKDGLSSWCKECRKQDHKKCSHCQTIKPKYEFYKDRSRPDGFQYWCKECLNEIYGRAKRPAVSPDHKYCPSCKTIKLKTEFNKDRSRPDGLSGYCKECRKLKYQEKYVIKQYEKAKLKEQAEKRKIISHNYRARKNNAPGSFTEKEFKRLLSEYKTCPCCGITFTQDNIEMDHVIPISNPNSNNYIFNIQPLCILCNRSKRDKIKDYRHWSLWVLEKQVRVEKQMLVKENNKLFDQFFIQ